MKKTPKLLPISKARERINAIRRISLENEKTDIDFIKSRLLPLIMGHTILTPTLRAGVNIFRARLFNSNIKPKEKKELSYPPPEFITKNQRANREKQTCFYGSSSYNGAILEIKPLPQAYVAISRWVVKKEILLANVGYTTETLKKYNSRRIQLPPWRKPSAITEKPTNKLIYNFFGEIFTQAVTPGFEHLYKISIAIAECMLGGEIIEGDSKFQGAEVGGLIYPTLAMNADADNIALTRNIIDNEYLEIQEVDFIHITQNHKITKCTSANSFKENGEIEWLV